MRSASAPLYGALALVLLPIGGGFEEPPFGVDQWTRAPGVVQEDWCDEGRSHDSDRERYCVVREVRIAAPRVLEVDAEPNGGIGVAGTGRSDVLIRARVEARAGTFARAREIVEAVRIETAPRVVVEGPEVERREGFSVSFRIEVPERSNLRLEAGNGGISITGVTGEIEAETGNGGLRLSGLGGNVRARTTNGGLSVDLEGSRWEGAGLDARTTNGGIRLAVPESYSAELEVGTTNGTLDLDFPITVSGRLDRHLRTTLGAGGAPVRVITTNGGVRLRRN